MGYHFVSELSQSTYQMFSIEHPLYNIYQSTQWAIIKKEWNHRFVGVYDDNKLVLASLVLYRSLPFGYSLFYLPKGPLADFKDIKLLSYFFSELKKFAKSKKAISIKLTPNVLLSSVLFKDIDDHQPVRDSIVIDNLEKIGFKHHGFNQDMYETAQPRFCAAFYYREGWLDNYNTKATKTITKALKKGVEIERLDVSKLDLFASIMSYTEKRKNISLRNQEYYQRIVDAFGDDAFMVVSKVDLQKQLEVDQEHEAQLKDQIENKLVSERKIKPLRQQLESLQKEIAFKEKAIQEDGQIVYISCLLAVKVQNTTELLYAGMNEKYRKYYGTYVTYMEGIKWGYQKGCTRCDFGGIQGTLDDGLTEFKGYFEPNIEEYVGEFDMLINKPVDYFFNKSLAFYKMIRRFLRGVRR